MMAHQAIIFRLAWDPEKKKPRIFLLSELEANGTNVGRKRRDWLPTVGAVHPWCREILLDIPKGWGFNDAWEIVPPDQIEG